MGKTIDSSYKSKYKRVNFLYHELSGRYERLLKEYKNKCDTIHALRFSSGQRCNEVQRDEIGELKKKTDRYAKSCYAWATIAILELFVVILSVFVS